MSVNKVTAFGENLIDLTEDTVTKETLIKGVTAHDASGNSVTGTFDTDKYLEKAGDASNTTAVFSASKERANISTGEKLSVIFGKIAKFFSDLKTVAFTGNYSDLSGTPSVVSKTADGLCPKNGGTTTKFLRDDGTYAVPTSSVIGLSTLEQVTAAATAGNVTAPVGAGALAEVNSSLQDSNTRESFNFGSLNGVRGFFTNPSRADDSFVPFKSDNSLALIVRWGSYSGGSSTVPFFYDDTLFNGLRILKPCTLKIFWSGEFRNNDGIILVKKNGTKCLQASVGTGKGIDLGTLDLIEGDEITFVATSEHTYSCTFIAMQI